jgi:hypothetical protein
MTNDFQRMNFLIDTHGASLIALKPFLQTLGMELMVAGSEAVDVIVKTDGTPVSFALSDRFFYVFPLKYEFGFWLELRDCVQLIL